MASSVSVREELRKKKRAVCMGFKCSLALAQFVAGVESGRNASTCIEVDSVLL